MQASMQASMQATMQASMQASMQAERTAKILAFCEVPRGRDEIQQAINIHNRDYFRKYVLNPLLEQGVLGPTIPDKPRSPNQKYYTIEAEG